LIEALLVPVLFIIFDDLFPNIKVIPKIRNQITRRDIQEIEPKELNT